MDPKGEQTAFVYTTYIQETPTPPMPWNTCTTALSPVSNRWTEPAGAAETGGAVAPAGFLRGEVAGTPQ
jgi:hypothetical protein